MPCSQKGITGVFRALVICLVFFLGFLVWKPMAAAQDRPAPVKEITVAVGQSDGPFYFRDQKGHADGWLVDLWRLWSQKTGIKVKFIMMPFGETLELTAEGNADVMGGCYIDHNMVRAGIVEHPSEWPFCGYIEIQKPKRKNVLINYCPFWGQKARYRAENHLVMGRLNRIFKELSWPDPQQTPTTTTRTSSMRC